MEACQSWSGLVCMVLIRFMNLLPLPPSIGFFWIGLYVKQVSVGYKGFTQQCNNWQQTSLVCGFTKSASLYFSLRTEKIRHVLMQQVFWLISHSLLHYIKALWLDWLKSEGFWNLLNPYYTGHWNFNYGNKLGLLICMLCWCFWFYPNCYCDHVFFSDLFTCCSMYST